MNTPIINPTCNINILHQERSGEPLDCNRCTMECEFKKKIAPQNKTAQA